MSAVRTVVAGGTVVDPVAGRAAPGDVVIEDGHFVGVTQAGEASAAGAENAS